MRSVEIRRHSFTKKGDARGRGSHLSVEGVLAARSLGASVGPFDYVVASTSPRTLETAIAIGVAVDDLMEMPSPTEVDDIEFHSWREWTDPFAWFQQTAAESSAFAVYISQQAAALLATLQAAPDGGRVLVVGHGGWMEAVIAALVEPAETTRLGGSFWHLDGVRILIGAGAPAVIDEIDRYPR